MYNCMTCEASVPDEFVFDGAEDHVGQKLHAVDTGHRHSDIDVHVVSPGDQRYGVTNHRYDSGRFEVMQLAGDIAVKKPSLVQRLRLALFTTTAHLFWADISYYQKTLTDAYNRSMVAFRLSFSSTLIDSHANANMSWAVSAVARRRLIAYMGYHVWYPGNTTAILARAMAGKWTSKGLLMIDLENWSGKITGDHSTAITAFIEACVKDFLGGNTKRICVYGNVGDLANLYPHRPSWLKVVVARYDDNSPSIHWDGWQFTDGDARYPVPSGFPRSSGAVGACDHDVAYMTTTQFLAAFGLSAPIPSGTAPMITVQPHDVRAKHLGVNVTFSFVGTGTPTPSIQWQWSPDGIKWYNLVGSVAHTHTTGALTAETATHQYRARFGNTAGTVYTRACKIHVTAPWPWPSTNRIDKLGNYSNPSVHVHGGSVQYDPAPVGNPIRASIVDVHSAFGVVLKRAPRLDVSGGKGVWGLWGNNTDADWLAVRKALNLGSPTDKTMSGAEYVTLLTHVGYL